MSDAVRGIVVAHSDMARALVEAVERIAGIEEDALVPVSNEGLRPEQVRDRLAELVGNDRAIIFTDLREGSCGMAARQVCLPTSNRVLITGVNLPVLLDFVMNRHLPLTELTERLLDRGRKSIRAMPEPAGSGG